MVSPGGRPGQRVGAAPVRRPLRIGHGIEKNLEQAIALYRKSAEQGYALGQTYLADMYFDGTGIQQDFARPPSGTARPPTRATRALNSAWASYTRGKPRRQKHTLTRPFSACATTTKRRRQRHTLVRPFSVCTRRRLRITRAPTQPAAAARVRPSPLPPRTSPDRRRTRNSPMQMRLITDRTINSRFHCTSPWLSKETPMRKMAWASCILKARDLPRITIRPTSGYANRPIRATPMP